MKQKMRGTVACAAFLLMVLLSAPGSLLAQNTLLRSGPMLGYSEMREVQIWVQTTEPARVKIRYAETQAPDDWQWTSEISTTRREACAVKLNIEALEPGRKYTYELFINNKKQRFAYPLHFQTQVLWQYRTDPPAFNIAVGSCAFVNETEYDRPGEPYGGNYEIFTAIHEKSPDAMLWLGDNTYLREVDWHSRSGMLHRYSHTRALPELQPLLASTHHYAIWDDHDFGPNNSDRSWGRKAEALEVFKLFWPNPYFGVMDEPGVTFSFEWGDVQFFMLDNRYHRTPNTRKTGERTMLGEHQFDWLVDALASSRAPFKVVVVGGQVLNPTVTSETFGTYAAERDRLLRAIQQEDIIGVVFVSGDRHRTEVSVLPRRFTYPLTEFTISPLTAGPYTRADEEPNFYRVQETSVKERNFAILSFSGPRRDRALQVTCYDVTGNQLWQYGMKATELR